MKSIPRRSRGVGLVAVALAAMLLTACGSSGESEGSGGGDEAASTRTVKDTFNGDVADVPTKPKRVVALWRTGSMLAELGVVPVGALQDELLEEEVGAEAYEPVSDVPTVGTTEGVDLEKVIKLKPDLIIGMDNKALTIDYKELQEVAPTVILQIAEPTDVWNNYPKIADLVGKTTNFEDSEKQLDENLAAVKKDHGDDVGDLETTSLGAFEGTIYVDTSKALSYERINAAGFGYNPKYTDNPERYTEELAQENIATLADQDIIFYDADFDGTPSAGTDELLETASFKRLPAAKAGNVFPLTSGTIYTFAAAEQQAKDLREAADEYEPSGS